MASANVQISDTMVRFHMGVKGGTLPKDYETNLTVECDITGITVAELCVTSFGSRSFRVILQAQLRALGADALDLIALKGGVYKCTFKGVMGRKIVSVKQSDDMMMDLDLDDFIAKCRERWDEETLSDDEIITIYNNKHNITD